MQLVELVKSVALNEEESQLVVNAILNNESESQWSQRNDPVTQLKRSLQDKETQLRTEAENREALKVRISQLRAELAAEKGQVQSVRSQCQQLQQELHKSQSGQRSATEQHRAELLSLQTKVRNECSAKAAATLNRVQDENNRLKDVVQKLEFDRSALDAIPHLQREVDQLRTERQQMDVTIAHLKQQSDEFVRENNGLKEQLTALSSSRQQDEFAMKQQLLDLQTTVREREAAAQAVAEELSQARDRLSQLTRDLEQLQQQDASSRESLSRASSESLRVANENNDLQTQVRHAADQMDQLKNRLAQLEQELSDARSQSSDQTVRIQSLEQECQHLRNQTESQDDSRTKLSQAEERISHLSNSESELQNRVSELKDQVSVMQQDKESLLKSLSSSFSHLALNDLSLDQAVDNVLQEVRENQGSHKEVEELRARNQQLEQEVATFTQSLKQTVSRLVVT